MVILGTCSHMNVKKNNRSILDIEKILLIPGHNESGN